MLESKSFYFPCENPPQPKGWAVVAKVPYEKMEYLGELDNPWNYQNFGCAGFGSRTAAETWLKEARETNYVPENAIVSFEYRK